MLWSTRGSLIVFKFHMQNWSIRRQHGHDAKQDERHSLQSLLSIHAQIYGKLAAAKDDGANDRLGTALKKVLYSSAMWRVHITSKLHPSWFVLLVWAMFTGLSKKDLTRDEEGLGKAYAEFGAGNLRSIHYSVEKFRKNQFFLVDGMELLCNVRELESHMLLVIEFATIEFPKVGQYSRQCSVGV